MLLSAITAVDQNNLIGKNNSLPWKLPADMRFFKKITMGHPVIMGRKTYESFKKALPGRTNIVITRQRDYVPPDAKVAHSLREAVSMASELNSVEAFILGGAQIYKQSLPQLDRLYLTRIYGDFKGDTYFPPFDLTEWEMTGIEPHEPDDENDHFYSFQLWERRVKSSPL